ncbi:MAG: F0F1 ATP synthase subunit A [Planctomycetia bacterium]
MTSWSSIPVLGAADPESHVLPHRLFELGGHPVTNHMVMIAVAGLVLMVLMPIAAAARSIVPTGLRNMVEAVLQFLREDVARPILGHETDRYIPVIWTLFFLILTANLLGMIPVGPALGLVDGHLEHAGGTATGNISIAGGLALISFLFIHIAGIREQGFLHYCQNFVPHVHPILLILFIPLELVAAVIKPFALAVRLFANMVAGHIVLAVVLGFGITGIHMAGGGYAITAVSVAGGVALSLLELFVAFLQAYLFTFLTTLFVGMAVHPEH